MSLVAMMEQGAYVCVPLERFIAEFIVFECSRLNDFLRFRFAPDAAGGDIPPSSLVEDLRQFVNSELLSDITFVGGCKTAVFRCTSQPLCCLVENIPVYAHKVMCMRCTYFRAMLTGEVRAFLESCMQTLG